MGRKKHLAGGGDVKEQKFFCFFCDRTFDDEGVLIQHQRGKHFRCPECDVDAIRGKCESVQGLIVHTLKVHGKGLARVPNAMQGRHHPELNVYGMDGIPEHVWLEKGLPFPGHAPSEPNLEPPPRPPAPAPSGILTGMDMHALPGGVPQDFLDFLGQASGGSLPPLPGSGLPGLPTLPSLSEMPLIQGIPALPDLSQPLPQPPLAALAPAQVSMPCCGGFGGQGQVSQESDQVSKRPRLDDEEDVSFEELRARLPRYLTPRR